MSAALAQPPLVAPQRGRGRPKRADNALGIDADILATPNGFVRGVLGHHIWSMPRKILDSVATNRRTAVKSCHASGKTFTSAEAALWWITKYSDGIAITTAPTDAQVEKLLWGEIRKAMLTSKIKYPTPTKKMLMLGEGNYAYGRSTNEGVNFQGFHSNHLLFIFDEAPGVHPEIWEIGRASCRERV